MGAGPGPDEQAAPERSVIIVTSGQSEGKGGYRVSAPVAGAAPEHAEASGRRTGQAFPGVRASSPDPDMY